MTKEERREELRSKYIAAVCYGGCLILGIIPLGMRLRNDVKEIQRIKAAEEQETSFIKADKQITGAAGVSRALSEYMQGKQPTEVVIVPRVEPRPVNQDDLELLARLIHAEVGCIQDDECLYYCGSVVLNRVAAGDFPDTIREVIYQNEPVQYACTIDGNINEEPTEREYEIAADILRHGSYIPSNVIYQSEFTQGSREYKRFENVIFCYR